MRRHGTRGKYQKEGCRCQACVAANSAYQRQRYAHRKSMTPHGWKVPKEAKSMHGLGVGITGADLFAQWRENAECQRHDADLWDIDNPAGWQQAMTICGQCPVRRQCHNAHIGNDDAFGIYAGMPLWAGHPLQRRKTA